MSTWADVRDAMHAGIVSASGLDAEAVVWKYQDRRQPILDDEHQAYIALSLTGIREVGQDWVSETYVEDQPLGEEIELAVVGIRAVVLQLEVYTLATVDSDSEDAATALGDRIRGKLRLPTARNLFKGAGVTPFDLAATIQYIPTIVSAGFRGRGLLDIGCYAPADSLAEYVGYITRVTGTLTAHGGGAGDTTIDLDVT